MRIYTKYLLWFVVNIKTFALYGNVHNLIKPMIVLVSCVLDRNQVQEEQRLPKFFFMSFIANFTILMYIHLVSFQIQMTNATNECHS